MTDPTVIKAELATDKLGIANGLTFRYFAGNGLFEFLADSRSSICCFQHQNRVFCAK
jgi:hypothetical protein